MCYHIKQFTFLLSIMFTAMVVQAQQMPQTVQLSLNQVWQQAEVNNKRIQMQQLRVQSSDAEIKDAKTERLPDIDAVGEYARVSNLPLFENGLFHTPTQYPVLHTYYRVGGDAFLNIYNGNKTNIKIAEQKTEKQIRVQQKNLTTSDIKLSAAGYYLQLQRGNMFKALTLQDIADQERQLQQIIQLQKHGVVLKSDVLRAQLQLSRLRLSLDQINNDIAIANQRLNILIGQPDSTAIVTTTQPNADSLTLKSLDSYLADALHHSFQLKQSEYETEMRRLQIKDVKANKMPRVGLFANYAYTYPQIQFYPYSAYLYGLGMAGIRASFSVSNLYKNKYKETASRLELEQQELEHADTWDAIRSQVTEAYLRYQEALNRISVARTNITQATENARIVNNTYFNQLSLVTDLLDANTQLLQTRFDLAAAQIAAQMQYYQLQKVIGNL